MASLACLLFTMGCKAQQGELVFTDYQTLLEQKAHMVQNDPNQYARLIDRADLLLAQAPESVTQKKTVLPSGDRHDYLSLAPYWWPDPNQPEGLPCIRRWRSTRTNPGRRTSVPIPP